MKRFLGLAIGLFSVIGFTPSAEATIQIKIAEVQNGVAFIKGSAQKKSSITWETQLVTFAEPDGSFSFNGVVPTDCVGTLSDGTSTIEVAVLDCVPVSAAPALVPRTGQTTSYAAGDDGALQKGVAWPTPRFTDNNNGTITDNLTGLIWLKNANCPAARRVWPGMDEARQQALDDVAQLNTDGTMNGNNCGDTSNAGSHQTDWRLPNVRELQSLVDYGVNVAPVLPSGYPFSNFQAANYWSSSTWANFSGSAWFVTFAQGLSSSGTLFAGGSVGQVGKDGNAFTGFVIAVRGGS